MVADSSEKHIQTLLESCPSAPGADVTDAGPYQLLIAFDKILQQCQDGFTLRQTPQLTAKVPPSRSFAYEGSM